MRRVFQSLMFTVAVLGCAVTARPQSAVGEVDVFAGVDFKYRDIYYSSLFETLVRLTPGARWRFAEGWDLAGQIYLPVYNEYGRDFWYPQLNIATVSKQMRLGRYFAVKASAGIFSNERYGLDLKGLYMATSWLAMQGQCGVTGHGDFTLCRPYFPRRGGVSGQLGAVVYIAPATLEMRALGGKYVGGDWGCEAECIRHFKHTSVSLNGRWSQRIGKSFGFHVTVMLPPYTRRRHKVNFRPASNFEFNYTNRTNHSNNIRYQTDPEENMRTGWFDPQVAPWGFNAEHSDYKYVRSNPNDSIQP